MGIGYGLRKVYGPSLNHSDSCMTIALLSVFVTIIHFDHRPIHVSFGVFL